MSRFLDNNGLVRVWNKIKALLDTKASSDLTNVSDSAFAEKTVATQVDTIYTATSSDGVAYTATIPGITELTAGLKVTVKLSRNSASTAPTLNVNGLGAKTIRQPLSMNNSATTAGPLPTWLNATCPVTLTYSGTQWKTDFTRSTASYLYGTVAIANGGTGATTAEAALTNLGGASVTYVDTKIAELVARIEALES